MKVRFRMLGNEVLPATLVDAPSQLSRGEMVAVLEIDAGAPLQVEPPGGDVEIVEASEQEWKQLAAAGYAPRRA